MVCFVLFLLFGASAGVCVAAPVHECATETIGSWVEHTGTERGRMRTLAKRIVKLETRRQEQTKLDKPKNTRPLAMAPT